jgi:hypothetical protein
MERRPKPDLDTVREALRQHDEREAADEADRDDDAAPEPAEEDEAET